MNKICKNSIWDIQLSKKKKPVPIEIGIKPGTEMAEKVNMHVDISESEDETAEISEVKLTLEKENKDRLEVSVLKKNKPRFKHGSDLTEKVNLMQVEVNETEEENLETFAIAIKLNSSVCINEELANSKPNLN